MPPSGARYTFSNIDFSTYYCFAKVRRIFKEFGQIKDVHFIHMNILAVTSTKSYHLSVTNGR